jgi:hypothetical protein
VHRPARSHTLVVTIGKYLLSTQSDKIRAPGKYGIGIVTSSSRKKQMADVEKDNISSKISKPLDGTVETTNEEGGTMLYVSNLTR